MNDYDDIFYRKMADAYFNNNAWTKLRMAQVTKLINPQKEDKIIDLGCGMGATIYFCSTFGAEVTGVYLSPIAIHKAKEFFKDSNIRFYETDVSDLHIFNNESFDKAISLDLIEHIPQETFEKMLKEVFRCLRKGDVLGLYTPSPSHLIERLTAHNFIIKQNPTHIALKRMEDIKAALVKNGFKIEVGYYTPSFIPLLNIERMVQLLPYVGDLFKYRICVNAIKSSEEHR